MAAFTSTQTGDFNDGGTWGNTSPGVAGTDFPNPTGADTFTVASGHVVTIPDGHNALSSGSVTGTLVIGGGASGSLKLDANLTMNEDSTKFQMKAGSTLDVNANDVVFATGTTDNSTTAVDIQGTSGSRITIKSTSTHGNFSLTGTKFVSGDLDLDFVDFSGLTEIWLHNNHRSGHSVIVRNTTFTGYNRIHIGEAQLNLSGTFILENIDLRDTVGANQTWAFSNFVNGTGTITIDKITCDNAGSLIFRSFAITDNVTATNIILHDTLLLEQVSGNVTIDSWLITDTGAGQEDIDIGTMKNGYYFSDQDNSHPFAPFGDTTLDSSIVELTSIASGGPDIFIIPSNVGDYAIKNTILLLGREGALTTTLVSVSASSTLTADHNTVVVNGTPSNEGYGMLCRVQALGQWAGTVNIRSNIAQVQGVSTNSMGINFAQDTTVDQVDFTDNNAFVNITDHYVDVTITGKTEGVTSGFGLDDITDDPQFVDDTVTLADWDSSLGGAGTAANAITEMLKLNQSGFDSNYTVAAAVAYIRAGFTPTNSAYQGTAHDSGDIGAVAAVVGVSLVVTIPAGPIR